MWLAIDGVPSIGAVALPGSGRCCAPIARAVPPRPKSCAWSSAVPARAWTKPLVVAEKLGAELVPMGSAGAKAMAIVLGDADIYLHSGGQYRMGYAARRSPSPWRTACTVSRIDGSPLVYNQREVYMPDLLICRKEHAAMVLAEIAALGEG